MIAIAKTLSYRKEDLAGDLESGSKSTEQELDRLDTERKGLPPVVVFLPTS